MSEGGSAGEGTRSGVVSGLMYGAAVVAVVAVGAFAERQSRELAVQVHRAETGAMLESRRVGLEMAFAQHRDMLSWFAGLLATTPVMTDAGLPDVLASLAALKPPSGSVADIAVAREGGELALYGHPELAEPLRRTLAGAQPGVPGVGALIGSPAPMIALWQPVPSASDAVPGGGTGGCAIAILNTETLFREAGFSDPELAIDFALVAAPNGQDDPRRALHLGHGSVLLRDPVETRTTLGLTGGGWTLAAAPRGGWEALPRPGAWPVWLVTLLSVGFVGLAMLRTRRLVHERQQYITELHDRESELRRVSQRLDLALDASKVGVWDFDTDTSELIWDARMDELYAVPADRVGRSYADWQARLHPEDQDRAQADFAEAIRTSSIYRSDYRLVLPDGTERHIRAIGQPARDQDGRPKLVGVNWDVTAEEERRAELEARRHEAETATLAKSQFLATVSHELRTPMNGVIGMLDLLLRSQLDDGQRERAQIARDSAEHLLRLLNDVLDLSKLEAERIVLDALPIDPAQIGRDIVALMSAPAEERGIDLCIHIDGVLPERVLGDATRLRQVMMNLVGNAIKFTDTGCVEIRIRHLPRDGGVLEVVVRDTGIGIPEEARLSLFQRFAQVDGSDVRKRGGTGLGLAICKQLIERMGGDIGVESVEGLGSTFSFRIPAPPCAAVDGEPAVDGDDLPHCASARILVAEDNTTNQKVLLAYLEIAGHDVHLVSNGAEAVEAAAAQPFDLVLLDIQMPVMDGVAAARAIRAHDGPNTHVPILALTAAAAVGDRERFLAAGITDYLSKPVTMQALFSAISRVTAEAAPAADPDPLGDAAPEASKGTP